MKIAIVDYGMGNIHSLKSALIYISPNAVIDLVKDNKMLDKADLIFLPGVGHFKVAMEKLVSLNLVNTLRNLVLDNKKPIMGICLGMQLLFKNSSEGGINPGIGLLNAKVRHINEGMEKTPHIGFNSVEPAIDSYMFNNIENLDFYFVHSYCVNETRLNGAQITYCNYNEKFVAAVESNNIWGTQFHPEKSQKSGLQLLSNFIRHFAN